MQKSSLRSSQRIIPGHNESWSSQKPSLWDSSWLGYASAPQGRVLRQINQRGQRKVTGPRGHEDLENCTFLKNWHFPKVGLSLWASSCDFLHVLFLSINFFLYSLPCASSSEFFLDSAGKTRDLSPNCCLLWSNDQDSRSGKQKHCFQLLLTAMSISISFLIPFLLKTPILLSLSNHELCFLLAFSRLVKKIPVIASKNICFIIDSISGYSSIVQNLSV